MTVLLLSLTFAGCGDDRGPAGFDAGERSDAAGGDAGGSVDAGGASDAGADAGLDGAFDGGSDGGSDAGPPPPPYAISNEADFGPLRMTGLVLGPPSGTFDTDADCVDAAPLGECTPVALGGPRVDACVCRADEVVIGDLRVTGSRALVVLAWRRIEIVDRLDVSGLGREPGPGAFARYEAEATGSSGGAGGSFGTTGGGSAAETYGADDLVPLVGGMDGQSACGPDLGGGGGGAVQLSAGEVVLVTGAIVAGGGGGRGGGVGDFCNGGRGGGSGGAVLVEAPRVEMRGTIAANGGGAGSGGTTSYSGNSGSDADSLERASGGPGQREPVCALYDDIFSGSGGSGAILDETGGSGGSSASETRCIGDSYAGAGGGGGGVGRVRVNTERGALACICSGEFSPAATFGELALAP
jgi:hypothetical protein